VCDLIGGICTYGYSFMISISERLFADTKLSPEGFEFDDEGHMASGTNERNVSAEARDRRDLLHTLETDS